MTTVPSRGLIKDVPLSDALSERYLAYALSTIVARSLPDVRDGLKPVHRRLLYAMRLLKLNPDTGFKKCARVVGDVIGKYHPHGDVAVYDAMVRLAQEFAVRYPLVEGQGNFGNIDGDNAAAMRYTEARLTVASQLLMDGLDEDTVDFRPTYDGEEQEPVVMPAAYPNLLANGSSGIAVGMATNIPPHNVAELCDALSYLIKNPEAPTERLLEFVRGPDFPTGGVLVESEAGIKEAYETGRGGFRLRARWAVEKLSPGLYQVVITEIPYQVQKAKLIEKIAELLNAKKLPLLADVRDESAEDIRMVLEPRNRAVDPEVLMEHLFKQTDLEIRFSLNMNVLDADGTPKVMSLKDALKAYLDHRMVVLTRRSRYRLDKIAKRLELLDGYLIAYLNLDEVIRIIREEDEPKPTLMQTFSLTDTQAEAILNMRLRSLRRLEEMEIRGEHAELSTEQASLHALLSDEPERWKTLAGQIKEARALFDPKKALGRRRTDRGEAPDVAALPVESFVEKEPITVVLSKMGWIRAIKGHGETDFKFKEGDELLNVILANTTDKLLIFADNGRFYTLAGDKIPRGRGHGEPLRLIIDLPNEAQIATLMVHQPGRKLLLATDGCHGFIAEENEVLAQTRTGKQILSVPEGEKAVFCLPVTGDGVAVMGRNRKLLVFKTEEIPTLGKGRGVILQRIKDGGIADIKFFTLAEGLSYPCSGGVRTETNLIGWLGKRAGTGKLPPQGFPRNNKFS